jgi:hypothetical protein
MPMKRKPHQEGLDPENPGIPVTTKDLRAASLDYQKTQARSLAAQGVQQGSLMTAPVDVPQNVTGVDGPESGAPPRQAPPQRPAPPAGGNGQGPEPAIPASYNAGSRSIEDMAKKHPLLEDLEHNFGIEKLKCRDIKLGGYTWTFRPMRFEDYEWMANHVRRNPVTQESSEPAMSVVSVASLLAAVNRTPVYEMFGVDTTGRHIPDKLNPPPDIRYEAAVYLLEWFREKVGLWELISKLDAEVDLVFEDQRSREYPLWETLASTYRQRIIELKRQLESSMEDGKSGDDASQQEESSPPTPEPSSSGTTQQQPTSSSTGTTERSNEDWTD